VNEGWKDTLILMRGGYVAVRCIELPHTDAAGAWLGIGSCMVMGRGGCGKGRWHILTGHAGVCVAGYNL